MQILKQPFIAKKSMKFFHVHEKGEKIKIKKMLEIFKLRCLRRIFLGN
jgi:hypothetical protein